MKILLTTLICLIALASVRAQVDSVKMETEKRKAYAMEYLDELFDLDSRTERLVGAMVELYVQSVIRTAEHYPVNDRTKSTYDKLRENNFQLISSYLTEEQMKTYREALNEAPEEDAGGAETCIYCDFPRKAGRDHCVFCGWGFE